MKSVSALPHALAVTLLAMMTLVIAADAQARSQLSVQVWIEPGQTPAELDSWFAQLEAAHMPVARLFMMWKYLEKSPN